MRLAASHASCSCPKVAVTEETSTLFYTSVTPGGTEVRVGTGLTSVRRRKRRDCWLCVEIGVTLVATIVKTLARRRRTLPPAHRWLDKPRNLRLRRRDDRVNSAGGSWGSVGSH